MGYQFPKVKFKQVFMSTKLITKRIHNKGTRFRHHTLILSKFELLRSILSDDCMILQSPNSPIWNFYSNIITIQIFHHHIFHRFEREQLTRFVAEVESLALHDTELAAIFPLATVSIRLAARRDHFPEYRIGAIVLYDFVRHITEEGPNFDSVGITFFRQVDYRI